MWRPRQFFNRWQMGVAIVLAAGLVFSLDVTPARAAADGAAYGLVLALAAYSGRRAVIAAALLSVFLTSLAPFLGAEGDETPFQILSGRLIGLLVIVLFTTVLLHLIEANTVIVAHEEEIAEHQQALRKITRLALAANKSLAERLQIITEWTVAVLGVDRVCVGRVEGSDFHLVDAWDRRVLQHVRDHEPPACYEAEFRELIANDLVMATPDVRQSKCHETGIPFYEAHNIRSILHTAAAHRDEVVASVIITNEMPHDWSEGEIAFAKSVSQIVALIFALDHSERSLQRLDRVSQAIFVLNKEGRVDYANAAARHLAGAVEGSLPPPIPFALPPLAADKDHQELRFHGREYDIYRVRLPESETLVRVEDVTQRNEALAEAARMHEQVKESAKLQAMGQMAAGIAHDFNNILAAILAFAQGQARMQNAHPSDSNAVERNLTERILGVCKRGKSLTDEILGFARTASVERSEMDLSELLGSDLDVVPVEGDNPATLTVLPPAEPLLMEGNGAQLLQLIQNLAVNAMHACSGGEGHIVISAGRASPEELRALRSLDGKPHERLLGVIDPARDYCFLRVADNGHGIPPAVMDRMFEPFFTTKGRSKGSGLGLVVVHGVVDTHNGCCHVHSKPDQGTVFTIYLPLISEAAIAAA